MSIITSEQRELFHVVSNIVEHYCNCRCEIQEFNGKAYLIYGNYDTNERYIVNALTDEEIEEGTKEYKELVKYLWDEDYEDEEDDEDA